MDDDHIRARGETETAQISEDEVERRRRAFGAARASVELEGYSTTPEYEVQAERFIRGEISWLELTAVAHEQAHCREALSTKHP